MNLGTYSHWHAAERTNCPRPRRRNAQSLDSKLPKFKSPLTRWTTALGPASRCVVFRRSCPERVVRDEPDQRQCRPSYLAHRRLAHTSARAASRTLPASASRTTTARRARSATTTRTTRTRPSPRLSSGTADQYRIQQSSTYMFSLNVCAQIAH